MISLTCEINKKKKVKLIITVECWLTEAGMWGERGSFKKKRKVEWRLPGARGRGSWGDMV